MEIYPDLAEETRSSVNFNYSATWGDTLARDPLRSLFFGKTDYTMDMLMQGAVILVDLPVDEKTEIGRVANGLARWAAQRAILRRNDLTGKREAARPVAIIWDECQKTLCENDVSFQATARDQRCMILGGTQTIGFMRAPVGKDLGEGFASNFNTKIFYQNQDPETNRFMSETISKIVRNKTKSKTTDSKGHTSKTREEVEEDAVPARMAQDLKSGGEEHDNEVTAILTRGGQQFPLIFGLQFGRRAMKVKFNQNCWNWGWLNKDFADLRCAQSNGPRRTSAGCGENKIVIRPAGRVSFAACGGALAAQNPLPNKTAKGIVGNGHAWLIRYAIAEAVDTPARRFQRAP